MTDEERRTRYYLRRGKDVRGPYAPRALRALGDDGDIVTGDLVGRSPTGPWQDAETVRGLRVVAPPVAPWLRVGVPVGLVTVALAVVAVIGPWDDDVGDEALGKQAGSAAAAHREPVPDPAMVEPVVPEPPPLPVIGERDARLRLVRALVEEVSGTRAEVTAQRIERLSGWTTDAPAVLALIGDARATLERLLADEARRARIPDAEILALARFALVGFGQVLVGVHGLSSDEASVSRDVPLILDGGMTAIESGVEVAKLRDERAHLDAALRRDVLRLRDIVRAAVTPWMNAAAGETSLELDLDAAVVADEEHVLTSGLLVDDGELLFVDVTRADGSRGDAFVSGAGGPYTSVSLGPAGTSPPSRVDVGVITPDGCRRGVAIYDDDDRRDDERRWIARAAPRVALLRARPGLARGLALVADDDGAFMSGGELTVTWSDGERSVMSVHDAEIGDELRSKDWAFDPADVRAVLTTGSGLEYELDVSAWPARGEVAKPDVARLAAQPARAMHGLALHGGPLLVSSASSRFEPGEPEEGGRVDVAIRGSCGDCATRAHVVYAARIDAEPHHAVHVCDGCTSGTYVRIVNLHLGAVDDVISELAEIRNAIPDLISEAIGTREKAFDEHAERATELAEALEPGSPAQLLALTIAADCVRHKGNARTATRTNRGGSALAYFQEAREMYTDAWELGGGGRHFAAHDDTLTGDVLRVFCARMVADLMLREAEYKAKSEYESDRKDARNLVKAASRWIERVRDMEREGLTGAREGVTALDRLRDEVRRLLGR